MNDNTKEASQQLSELMAMDDQDAADMLTELTEVEQIGTYAVGFDKLVQQLEQQPETDETREFRRLAGLLAYGLRQVLVINRLWPDEAKIAATEPSATIN